MNSKSFLNKKEIHLYTTENETKWVFAVRNILLLKNIIHKNLKENWTWTYVKKLLQLVNTMDSCVNCVAQLHRTQSNFQKNEPLLISLAGSTIKYKQNYEEGDLVRIAKPDEIFRKIYKQKHTDEVYTVFKFATLNPPMYNLIDANNVILEGNFNELDLVQVNILPVED